MIGGLAVGFHVGSLGALEAHLKSIFDTEMRFRRII
jgi:hypothetical protein